MSNKKAKTKRAGSKARTKAGVDVRTPSAGSGTDGSATILPDSPLDIDGSGTTPLTRADSQVPSLDIDGSGTNSI
jgi:hypothetical protein